MTKLFKKFLTTNAAALAVLCSFACSDRIAGTAEEPNQSANRPPLDEGSSSSEEITTPPETITSSSSNKEASSTSRYSSSEGSREDHPTTPPSSSSNSTDGGPGGGPIGNPDISPSRTLNDYLLKYNITEIAFDQNVIAYNKTFVSCDETNSTCSESPEIASLRTAGLHKANTQEDYNNLSNLFPITAKAMGGLHEIDGCPLYVLNIKDTSPVVHVLTKISKDTISIADVSDNCSYEARPFDMHVGFLFAYCGELSKNPHVTITYSRKDSLRCGEIGYDEYFTKKW